jgi:hypothetical protein
MPTGAIKYFNERGLWTAEHQKHNDELVKRQDTFAAAWAAYKAKASADDNEFKQGWMKARADELTKAGMEPVLTAW